MQLTKVLLMLMLIAIILNFDKLSTNGASFPFRNLFVEVKQPSDNISVDSKSDVDIKELQSFLSSEIDNHRSI